MKKILFIPLTALMLSGCFVQKHSIIVDEPKPDLKVVHVVPFAQKGDTGGVYYSLPRTLVAVDIEITRTDYVKGPYAAYASKYLGLSVPQANSVSYEIKSLKVSTLSEPDPDQLYFVSIPKDDPIRVNLSESGLILGFNAVHELNPAQPAFTRTHLDVRSSTPQSSVVTESNLLEKVDTLVEFSGADSLREQRVLVRRTLVEKSPEQRAKEAADEIFKLQENKLNLVTGFHEVNYSYETMRFMYEQLDKAEQELTRMFTGSRSQTVVKERYIIRPEAGSFETNLTLARFSQQSGLLSADATSGSALNIQLLRSHNNLGVAEFETSGADSTYTGLAYRIPGFSNLSIRLGQESLLETTVQVNQFGVVARLSPGRMPVRFHPMTGSLRD